MLPLLLEDPTARRGEEEARLLGCCAVLVFLPTTHSTPLESSGLAALAQQLEYVQSEAAMAS
jgi:hypothetical protein